MILDHPDDRSYRWLKEFGHIGSTHMMSVITSKRERGVPSIDAPMEFQLARLDVQFGSFVPQPPKFDELIFVWVDKSRFGRLVKLFGNVRDI